MNFSKYFICISTPTGERQRAAYTEEEARKIFDTEVQKAKESPRPTYIQLLGYNERTDRNTLVDKFQSSKRK